MSNKKVLYWVFQILGWGIVIGLAAIAVYFRGDWTTDSGEIDPKMGYNVAALFIFGILVSHLYRIVIIKLDWLRHRPLQIVPRVILGSVVFGALFYGFQSLFVVLILDQADDLMNQNALEHILAVINVAIIMFFWSLIYVSAHFIDKSRKQEIQGLQLDALKSEMELSNLKSQLNPHFIFNAMNSIRALIDENPEQAKSSITLLSNILRSTLVMGKKEVVTVADEMSVVRDYLAIERIRYEERLNVSFDVDDSLMNCTIPPLMIQTIVENAIKHGISKLPGGGDLKVSLKSVNDRVQIKVENTGQLISDNGSDTGIGLKNTRKRLYLLYDKHASFNIENIGDSVVVTIDIPKLVEYESITDR